jgi:uncharacterized membrane protein YraQ (UPF0718 family)/copper chaperone CopZ
MNIIIEIVKESINLWFEVAFYLLLGMVIAGVLHLFLGKQFISRHLGRGGVSSIAKSTLLGIPLPVCSCGVIPLASSLEKEGAHKSSVLSFLVSTPTTGVDSILATYSLMGGLFAIFRPLGSLLAGIIVGVLDYSFGGKKSKPSARPIHSHENITSVLKWKEFVRYSFSEIPQDIGKWLIIGTLLGGTISVLIPNELFSQYITPPFDFVVALLTGIPLYVCATGSIPVASSLIQKGFSPGAALIFLIVGPATNVITLSFVRAKLGRKSFYLYLASITAVALGLGVVFNHFWALLGNNPEFIKGAGKMLSFEFKLISGIILFGIIAKPLFRPKKDMLRGGFTIKVPDIHCAHCKTTLESSIKELPGVERVYVDVKAKVVGVKGAVTQKEVTKKIEEAGYHPYLGD